MSVTYDLILIQINTFKNFKHSYPAIDKLLRCGYTWCQEVFRHINRFNIYIVLIAQCKKP